MDEQEAKKREGVRARLERRNALWAALRAAPPGTPGFEAALADLSALAGWPRARVLAGLGLTGDEAPEADG